MTNLLLKLLYLLIIEFLSLKTQLDFNSEIFIFANENSDLV